MQSDSKEDLYKRSDIYRHYKIQMVMAVLVIVMVVVGLALFANFNNTYGGTQFDVGQLLLTLPILLVVSLAMLYVVNRFTKQVYLKGKGFVVTEDSVSLGARYFGPFSSIEDINFHLLPSQVSTDLVLTWDKIAAVRPGYWQMSWYSYRQIPVVTEGLWNRNFYFFIITTKDGQAYVADMFKDAYDEAIAWMGSSRYRKIWNPEVFNYSASVKQWAKMLGPGLGKTAKVIVVGLLILFVGLPLAITILFAIVAALSRLF
jgi:hypothetical protein